MNQKPKRLGLMLPGFTLIEILVAMALMAMVGLLLLSSISNSITAKENVEAISTQTQMVRQALSRMAKEISMAYLSAQVNFSDPAYITAMTGTKNKLIFTAFGNVIKQKDAKESDQRILSYFVDKDEHGSSALMRRIVPHMALDLEKAGKKQVLCPNVKSIEFSYFDRKYDKWDSQWNSQNEPTIGRLPTSVRITLIEEAKKGQEVKWSTETPIWLSLAIDLK